MMQIFRCGTVPLLVLLASTTIHPVRTLAQGPPPTIGVDTLLAQETNLGQLPYLRNWTTYLQSSYDRTGGNADSQHFLSMDGTTGVMADMDGPGAVTRIWSANPNGEVKIYIDGSPTPVIDTPFNKLLDGSTPPFAPPLTMFSSGGWYTYFPIPYAQHCKITVDDPHGLYYHVNYVTYPAGTNVRSFALPLTPSDQSALTAADAAWTLAPGVAPQRVKTQDIDDGKIGKVADYKGPGVIQHIRLQVTGATDLDLRKLVLRGYFDNQTVPYIVAPVTDFFGNAFGRKTFRSLFLACNDDGFQESFFPMPFGQNARFEIENGTGHKVSVIWSADFTKARFDPKQEGYFHALRWQEITVTGTPHIWTHVKGQQGHFVGIVQTMSGHHGLGFLEGEEQFRVDSQTWGAPPNPAKNDRDRTVNGTGTEDCFDSGWYFDKGPVALPINGDLVKVDSGDIDAYRWFINDAPVFQSSLDGQIEHGGANNAPGRYYSSVAYWYATGPSQPWAPMPKASDLAAPTSPEVKTLIPGAIEGESLVGTAKITGTGTVSEQDMEGYAESWSNDAQLCWSNGVKYGDTLTLTITPPAAGTYDLSLYLTLAPNYGQFSFQVNGQPIGNPVDLYGPRVAPTGQVPLGRVTLPAGPSTLMVTVYGNNGQSKGFAFGLDALVLKAVTGT